MSLKKNLKTGQAAIEYIIIFAAIGSLVLIGVSSFLQQVSAGAQGMYTAATTRILE